MSTTSESLVSPDAEVSSERVVDQGGIVFAVIREGKIVTVLHSSAQGGVEKSVELGPILPTEDDSIDTIFSRYHRTRNLLSNTDAACLESFTNKCHEKIDHLQGHVAKLQQDVFQLCQQIAESLAKIDQQQGRIEFTRSLQSPIRSLPPETLDMIFKFALIQSRKSLGYVASDRTGPPMVVSQVCKLWRDVALRNSKLWNSFRIIIRDESPEALSSQQHLFESFIERSQSRALTLCIVNPRYSGTAKDFPGHRQFLEQAVKAFPKCSSFETHVQSAGFYGLLTELEGATTTWPNLTRLSICSDMFTWGTPLLKLFSYAPKLNYLELKVGITLGLGSVVIPYHHLEDFLCRVRLLREERPAQAIQDWQQLVCQCINARNLLLDFFKRDSTTAFAIEPFQPTKNVSLSNVTSITITNDYAGNADLILCAFTFPSLDCFYFDFTKVSRFLPKAKTASQVGVRRYFNLTEHFGGITELTLLRVSIEDDDLLELFKSAPQLTFLELLNFTSHGQTTSGPQPEPMIRDKHLVHLLSTMTATSHEDKGSFLPYLATLYLYYPPEEEDTAERASAYASMAKTRAKMNQKAVESGSRESWFDDPDTYFEFYLSFREGTRTADDVNTVIEAINKIDSEPTHIIFETDTLKDFQQHLELCTDHCSRVSIY